MGSMNMLVMADTTDPYVVSDIMANYATERFDGKEWPGHYEYGGWPTPVKPVRESELGGSYRCYAFIDLSGDYHDRKHDKDLDGLIDTELAANPDVPIFLSTCRC